MVRQSVVRLIPVGVLSAGAFSATTETASAIPLGPVPQLFMDSGESLSIFGPISGWFDAVAEWFKNLPATIGEMSSSLLTEIFGLLMLVLKTPLFIFNNSYIRDVSMAMAIVSILIVMILSMLEGAKRMLRKRYTEETKIYKRFFVALLGAGIAPFAFEKAFQFLNFVVDTIVNIGSAFMSPNFVGDSVSSTSFSWANTLFLAGFDIMLISTMVPILLQNGRRFFDLMCLSAITPLALTAWVFDDWRYLFNQWWNNVKKLSMTPLVYSIFIMLLGVFIFGTQHVVGGTGLILKFLIVLGGTARLANPPSFVKQRIEQGDDVMDQFKKISDTYTDVRGKVTLKGTREKMKQKDKNIKGLRKKHGKRNVKGLK